MFNSPTLVKLVTTFRRFSCTIEVHPAPLQTFNLNIGFRER
jgi:hypothetical protein